MSFAPRQSERRLLPRWRSFRETASGEELASVSSSAPATLSGDPDEYLAKKLAEWESGPNMGLAVDILSSAMVLGKTRELEAVGWWVLGIKDQLSPAVTDLAEACVNRLLQPAPPSIKTREMARYLLRQCRGLVGENPRDAVLYVDLALAHTMLGNIDHAKRAIKIAEQLAPDNRFVLRSAARYWTHVREPDRAHSLLVKSPRTRVDPWLLAAELSTASLAGRSPRFVTQSRVHLHNQASAPHHISELAGAMGTLEALDGRRPRARNYFNQSLVDPTENAVAQAVWAANANALPEFELEKFAHLHPHEAAAWQARTELNWQSAIDECADWMDDENFSVAPATLGSFMASVIGDHKMTQALAERGLTANPKNFGLRNNLVVSQIFQGAAGDLLSLVNGLDQLVENQQQRAIFLATSGLYLLTNGVGEDIDQGRRLYKKAIEMATEAGDSRTAAFAAGFWASAEELTAEPSSESLEVFGKLSKGVDEPELKFMRDRLLHNKTDAKSR